MQFDRSNQLQSTGATRDCERRAHREQQHTQPQVRFLVKSFKKSEVDHHESGRRKLTTPSRRIDEMQADLITSMVPPRGRKKPDFTVIQGLADESEREAEQQQELIQCGPARGHASTQSA